MNRLTIIGNLTADPVLNTTSTGKKVCNFNVAVNRRGRQLEGQPDADFFRVSVWDKLAESCQQYLVKGKKVAVVGSVSLHLYTGNDGATRGSLDVSAQEVEFLTPSGQSGAAAEGTSAAQAPAPAAAPALAQAMPAAAVVDNDDLPF